MFAHYYAAAVDCCNVILARKAIRDEDSCEMLNIIRSTRTMDPELVYSFLGLDALYQKMLKNNKEDLLASHIASAQTKAENSIAEFIEQYQ